MASVNGKLKSFQEYFQFVFYNQVLPFSMQKSIFNLTEKHYSLRLQKRVKHWFAFFVKIIHYTELYYWYGRNVHSIVDWSTWDACWGILAWTILQIDIVVSLNAIKFLCIHNVWIGLYNFISAKDRFWFWPKDKNMQRWKK